MDELRITQTDQGVQVALPGSDDHNIVSVTVVDARGSCRWWVIDDRLGSGPDLFSITTVEERTIGSTRIQNPPARLDIDSVLRGYGRPLRTIQVGNTPQGMRQVVPESNGSLTLPAGENFSVSVGTSLRIYQGEFIAP